MGRVIERNLRSAFDGELRDLSRFRALLSYAFGITLVPIFSGLDYVLFPDQFIPFLTLRLLNTVETLIIFSIVKWKKDLSRKSINILTALYFTSIAIMIAYMCHLTGGYESTYYAGINIVLLVMCLLMPWEYIYTVVSSVIIYTAYVALAYTTGFSMQSFVNNTYFLVSTILITCLSTYWLYNLRIQEFSARYKLKELDRLKSSFFANLSHELKTPMTLVLTPLENALRSGSLEMGVQLDKNSFESIRQNAYRLSGLITDLLELTKQEINKSRISPINIDDTRTYFGEIFNSVLPLMEKKKIKGIFECPDKLQGHFFDRAKIDKVVVNLLSNAIKFTPAGGTITLRVWDEKDAAYDEPVLHLRVKDTGVGIPKENLETVFERFVQVDDSSTRAFGGMGIGLSLVSDFVAQHGGKVAVDSVEGEGACFSVTLPRGQEHFQATVVTVDEATDIGKGIELPRNTVMETIKASGEEETSAQKAFDAADDEHDRVLIVDDSSDMRQLVCDVLKDEFQVMTAQDGDEGGRLVKQYQPDLVISDVMMPVKDGYQLVQDMKADDNTKDIPVILLTAKTGEESLALGFEIGADDYLQKPFQPKEVLSRVRNLIRIRRQKEKIENQRNELAAVNRALKETEAELVQSEKLSTIGTMAAGLAHEINNPAYSVTLSLGNLEALVDECKDRFKPEDAAEMRGHLDSCLTELERIKKVVGTFLNYSRKNRHGFSVQDLSENIDNTFVFLNHLIEESGIHLHWESKKGQRPIEADHGALGQVFTNLIQNSLQANCHNLWFDLNVGEQHCQIIVRDDGCGMSDKVRSQVFDPFFTTKEVGEGTGLGLSIVHRIVSAHHGTIDVLSEMGKGTEFTITLPMRQPDEVDTRFEETG